MAQCKMRPLTNETKSLIDDLWRLGVREGIFTSPNCQQIVAVVEKIAACEEPEAVAGLIAFLFWSDRRISEAARNAVERLLAPLDPRDYPYLEEALRQWRDCWNREWRQFSMRSLSRLSPSPSQTWMLGLASFHSDGYIRQAAVGQLGNVWDGRELPFLLLRLNDWVAAVRDDSLRAVTERLRESYVSHLLRCLPLLARLLDWTRTEHEPVVRQATHLVVSAGESSAMSLLRSPDPVVRRKLGHIALNFPGPHQAKLVQVGLESTDLLLRTLAARQVPRALAGDALQRLLVELRCDKLMPVRRTAITALAELRPDAAPLLWRETLLDRHRSLRELARFELKPLAIDFAAIYREVLRADPQSIAALSGLGETGSASDAEFVRPYLQASQPGIRRAAVSALARLSDGHEPELQRMVADSSPAVVRAARDALLANRSLFDPGQLCQLSLADSREKVGIAVLAVLDKLGKWQSLPFLIQLAGHSTEAVALRARELIAIWFTIRYNQVFRQPFATEREQIRQAFEATQSKLGPSFRQQLMEWLEACG